MKYLYWIVLLTGYCSVSFAQESPSATCDDKRLHSELVTLNQSFAAQGFNLHQFSMLSLPADSYIPIMVSLNKGKMYQINFLADPEYQNYELVLIDQDKKELIKQKVKSKKTEDHYTSQSFVAPYTGNYWVILSQKVKGKKNTCGGFSILESGESSNQ